MDADEFDSESAYLPPNTTDEPLAEPGGDAAPQSAGVPPGRLESCWRGAKTGFRCTSYVAGPLASLVAVPSAALTAFGLGAGRGLGIHTNLPGAIGSFLVLAAYGAILGAVAGLIGSLVPPTRFGSRLATWWDWVSHPRRLLPRRCRSGNVPSRNRRRRWPWVVGAMVLSILTIAFVVGVYFGSAVDRRLANAIAAADLDDPHWRLDDLMAHRAEVPDDENSAIVVAEVISMLPENWPSPPAPNGEPNPSPTEAASAFKRLDATAVNVRLDNQTAETLRAGLNEYEDAVELARTVADYDRGRHEWEIGPTLYDTKLPETQAARTAGRLLAADAAIRAHDGDLDGALDSCRAILGVARSIGDEPFFIGQLVRMATGSVAMKSARRALGQGEPSDEALARLQTLVLDELDQPLYLQALRGERAVDDELIRRVGSGEIPISALSGKPFDPDAPRDAIAPWGGLWFDNQRAIALEWMNAAVAIAQRPPADRTTLWKGWDAEIVRAKQSRLGLYASTLPLLLIPAVNAADVSQIRHQAELGAMAILLAAERHRRKTGTWPESIDAIDRTILPSPPEDPCSGQPFLLERRDGEWLVHSVGPNLKDDHGAYEPKKWSQGGPDDIGAGAWEVDRRRQPSRP
jgi:hypothetical protein